ncbi:helix-turn-helix domain-containing protein [Thermus parvatiensis]|uniref:helix-turn-helix domain-containing protein n=1 Tax=Thermus parvatiensis TaxID=456163 RepID=UPI002ED90C53
MDSPTSAGGGHSPFPSTPSSNARGRSVPRLSGKLNTPGKTMRKAFKYRLYPTKPQLQDLERTLELCRQLYNAALRQPEGLP